MPRETFKPLSGQEQKFITHYAREGFLLENVWLAEKKARIPKGEGVKMLKRRHVAQDIERRKAQVELEEAKLIARDKAATAEQEARREKVTLDKLESALDSIVALDAKTHGAIKLAAIQTGLVYAGVLRNGRMERVGPTVAPNPDSAEGVGTSEFYNSVFDQMRAKQGEGPSAPLMPEPQVPAPIPPPPHPMKPAAPPAASAASPKAPAKVQGATIT